MERTHPPEALRVLGDVLLLDQADMAVCPGPRSGSPPRLLGFLPGRGCGAPRLLVALGRVARFAVEVVPSLATLGLILVLSGIPPWPRWAGVAAVWVLSLAASYGFAFLLFGLTLRFKDANSAVGLLGNAAPLLGGVFFPVALLPAFLRPLAYVFPFTYGVDAVRALWLGTPAMFPMGLQLGLLAALAVAYVALGWWALVRFERCARRHGLEGF